MRFRSGMMLVAVLTSPLAAQQQAGSPAAPMPAAMKSFTKKLFITGQVNAAGISLKGSDVTENGQGLSLGLGYGFSPKLAMYVEANGLQMAADGGGTYGLGHFDLGMRYHFANASHQWIPFLDAAFSGRAVSQNNVTSCNGACVTDDMTMSGTGFTFGGGVMWYATPKIALSGNLKWTMGEFDEVKFGNVTVNGLNQDATSTRFGLGMVWFPGAR